MKEEHVVKELKRLGYDTLTPEMISEFTERLQTDGVQFRKNRAMELRSHQKESSRWKRRLQELQRTADELDRLLQEGRSLVLDPPTEPHGDITMLHSRSRCESPYKWNPDWKNQQYIRPPKHARSKRKTMIEGGRILLYDEMYPQKEDKQKAQRDLEDKLFMKQLIYSHPDYQYQKRKHRR